MNNKNESFFNLKKDDRKNRIIYFELFIIIIQIFMFIGNVIAQHSGYNKYIGMLIGFLFPFAIFVGKELQYKFDYKNIMEILFAISIPIMVILGFTGLGIMSLFFWIAIPIIAIALYLCVLMLGAAVVAPIITAYLIYRTFFEKIEINNDNNTQEHTTVPDEDSKLNRIYYDNNIHEYTKVIDEDPEYYCEVCFKKISKEEWEENDCMCEECMLEHIFHEIDNIDHIDI